MASTGKDGAPPAGPSPPQRNTTPPHTPKHVARGLGGDERRDNPPSKAVQDTSDKSQPASPNPLSASSIRALNGALARRRVYFAAGILAGMLLTLVGITHFYDLNQMEMPSLPPLPQMPDALTAQISALMDPFAGSKDLKFDSPRPGMQLASEGYRNKHPVLMVPGIVTTGLEIWNGEGCASDYFRQRIWGTATMLSIFLRDKECWISHMSLDSYTSLDTSGVEKEWGRDDSRCGLDPSGVKVRPAQGFEATDYVIGGFWVWAKLIQNLADIGYDLTSMAMASYDWRLAYQDLERRDHFFSRTKASCEMLVQNALRNRATTHSHEEDGGRGEDKGSDGDEKVVVVTHSMGVQVWLHFMQWAEHQEPGWVDRHIASFVSLGGTLLGAPASLPRLLSGDLKDVAEMGALGKLMDLYVPHRRRRDLMRSWGSVYQLLPRGGKLIWGDKDPEAGAPDDPDAQASTCSHHAHATTGEAQESQDAAASADAEVEIGMAREKLVVEAQDGATAATTSARRTLGAMIRRGEVEYDIDEALGLFLYHKAPDAPLQADPAGPPIGDGATFLQGRRVYLGHDLLNDSMPETHTPTYRTDVDTQEHVERDSCGHVDEGDIQSRGWANPLAHPLPFAPKMQAVCMYGVGIPTERNYFYTAPPAPHNESLDTMHINFTVNEEAPVCPATARNYFTAPPVAVRMGITHNDGDALVPLVSLGLMCADEFGWNDPVHTDPAHVAAHRTLNPSGARATIREYKHEQVGALESVRDPLSALRGGPKAADHVNILGNSEVIRDILLMAATGEVPQRRVYSNIDEIAHKVNERAKAAGESVYKQPSSPGLQ